MSLLLGALAGGLMSGIQSGVNQGLSESANRRLQQQQNDHMYKMWNENNAYNTPMAQMQRFKDAGLNPNLIYGKGTPGNSQSPSGSAPYTPTKFNIDPLGEMFKYQNIKQVQANVDLTRSKQRQQDMDTLLKEKELGNFDDKYSDEKNIRTQTFKNLQSDAKIKQAEKRFKSLQADEQQFYNNQLKKGIYKSDNAFFRAVYEAAHKLGVSPAEASMMLAISGVSSYFGGTFWLKGKLGKVGRAVQKANAKKKLKNQKSRIMKGKKGEYIKNINKQTFNEFEFGKRMKKND